MSYIERIPELIELLRALPSRDGLMNPYASAKGTAAPDSWDEIGAIADDLRTSNLRIYLEQLVAAGSDVILCGEAPGFQGCRFSGIAFTAERDILEQYGPLAKCSVLEGARLGTRRVMKEPSGKAVWEAFARAPKPFINWNAVQLHPHPEGIAHKNRTPKPEEVELGKESLSLLIEIVQPRLVVAVGRTAQETLKSLGFDAAHVRHPAHGGKPEFMKGLQDLGVIGPALPHPQQSLF